MTKFSGCHNALLVMLLALLITLSQCRPVSVSDSAGKEEEREDEYVDMNTSIIELSSRYEIIKMAGYGEEKLSTVLITGMLVCKQPCLPPPPSHSRQHQLPSHSLPISGALVGATCLTNIKDKRTTTSRAEAVTDEYGEFIIDLPSHLHAIPDLDKACCVRVLQLPKNSSCHQSAFGRKRKGIKLSSVGNGIRTYTAGKMTILGTSPNNSEACMRGQEDEQEMSW